MDYLNEEELEFLPISDEEKERIRQHQRRTDKPKMEISHLMIQQFEQMEEDIKKVDEKLILTQEEVTKMLEKNPKSTIFTVPAQFTVIGECAFSFFDEEDPLYDYFHFIEEIHLPDTITVILEDAFGYMKNLKKINIPDSVTFIGCGAFMYCKSLEEIHIPENAVLGQSVFSSCISLQSVKLPTKTECIYSSTFDTCTNLENFEIPDKVRCILSASFDGCENLRSIIIPESVVEMSYQVFARCNNLKSIKLHDGIIAMGEGMFEECTQLEAITIPKGVIVIPNFLCYDCTSLKQVILHDGIKKIGQQSFRNCESLKSITIYDTVENIEDDAFGGCTYLEEIIIKGNTLPRDLVLHPSLSDYPKRLTFRTLGGDEHEVVIKAHLKKSKYNRALRKGLSKSMGVDPKEIEINGGVVLFTTA